MAERFVRTLGPGGRIVMSDGSRKSNCKHVFKDGTTLILKRREKCPWCEREGRGIKCENVDAGPIQLALSLIDEWSPEE